MIGCMVESSTSADVRLAELAGCLDLDGNLLVRNDPFTGPKVKNEILSSSAESPARNEHLRTWSPWEHRGRHNWPAPEDQGVE